MTALASALEQRLNEIARCGSLLCPPETYDQSKQHRKRNCAFCGVEFVGGNSFVCFLAKARGTRWTLETEDVFVMCSMECELAGERVVYFIEEERSEQWEDIKKSRLLLQEARAWLRRGSSPAA